MNTVLTPSVGMRGGKYIYLGLTYVLLCVRVRVFLSLTFLLRIICEDAPAATAPDTVASARWSSHFNVVAVQVRRDRLRT